MKTKIIIFMAVVLAVAVTFMYLGVKRVESLKEEVKRQTANVKTLNANVQTYKTAYGNSVAKVSGLTYTIKEMKAYEVELITRLKDAQIDVEAVQSVTQVGTQIIIRDTVPIIIKDSVECFTYDDAWNYVHGCYTAKDSVELEIRTRDKLDVVPTIDYKHRFFKWRWGVRGVNINVISQNPYSEFTYQKYIEIKR